MKVVYLPHHEFLEMIKVYERTSRYVSSIGVHNGFMELVFHDKNGGVIYRPRPLTKLEKVLK